MKYIATTFYMFVLVATMVFLTAGINATIVWWLWPHAVPAVLPSLVQSGIVAAELTWAQSFAVCWLSSIIFGKFLYSNSYKN